MHLGGLLTSVYFGYCGFGGLNDSIYSCSCSTRRVLLLCSPACRLIEVAFYRTVVDHSEGDADDDRGEHLPEV